MSIPGNEKTVSADTVSIPDVAKTVSADTVSISDGAKTIPDDTLSIPDVAQTIPADTLSSSGGAQLIPDDALSVPGVAQAIVDDAMPATIDDVSLEAGRRDSGRFATRLGSRMFCLPATIPPVINRSLTCISGKLLVNSCLNEYLI